MSDKHDQATEPTTARLQSSRLTALAGAASAPLAARPEHGPTIALTDLPRRRIDLHSPITRTRFWMPDFREMLELSKEDDRSCAAVHSFARAHLDQVERKIAALRVMRDELLRMIANCEQDTISDCRIIDTFSASHGL
jgi:hypothetical protein